MKRETGGKKGSDWTDSKENLFGKRGDSIFIKDRREKGKEILY